MSRRVLIVAEAPIENASTRYRALARVHSLQQLGWEVGLLVPSQPAEHRGGVLGRARYWARHALEYLRQWYRLRNELKRSTAVLVQRGVAPIGPGAIVRPLEHFRGRVVLDIDDAVFETSIAQRQASRASRWLWGPQQTERVAARMDAAVVSTSALESYGRGKPTVVIPTVPDVRNYPTADHTSSSETRIVWAGNAGNIAHLELIRDALRDIECVHGVHLTVVSSSPWDGPARYERWRLDDESTLFSRFQVGVMPLQDSPYARGKAGFKLLQYMAAGLPVVASPVGVNAELIQESGAGYVARSTEEWVRALSTLCSDPEDRERRGRAGRQFVERYADLNAHASEISKLLDPGAAT